MPEPQPDSPRPLFGQPGRSSIWAVDFPGEEDTPSQGITFDLPSSHFTAVCHLDGELELDFEGRVHHFESAPGFVFTKTDLRGGIVAPGDRFQGIIIGFQQSVIQSTFESTRPGLHPELRKILFKTGTSSPVGCPLPTLIVERWIPDLRNSPVTGPAASFWFEAKVREFLALACVHNEQPREDFFCSRQKNLARNRTEQTKAFLANHLDDPLDLEALASHVGCSRHYLSRTFSEYTGSTISQYLRRLRIERAAELLASGRFNVTEAAFEVGYQSLSHFSKAFQLEKGCLPSKFDFRAA